MAEWRLVLRSPQIGWGLATGVVLAVVLVAALVTAARRDTPQAAAVEQSLHFANGALVPGGRWSVLCIDGVAYLRVAHHSEGDGHPRSVVSVVAKHRRNGLIERCATTGRE
jgi:hypothetical protein